MSDLNLKRLTSALFLLFICLEVVALLYKIFHGFTKEFLGKLKQGLC